jgi:hypothetical protein
MKKILLLAVAAVLVLPIACGLSVQPKGAPVQDQASPVFALCEASGLFELEKMSTLRFTFNVRLPDKIVSRNWIWNIKEKVVYLDGTRVEPDDKRFINDKYWLLFPLMAHYDRMHTRVSINPQSQSPISNQACIEITVEYIDGGGYTPNDVYKLYCKDDMRIFEWAYYKAGREPPARVTQWTSYTDFNGIFLSMTRPSTGDFKVWFTGVSIK